MYILYTDIARLGFLSNEMSTNINVLSFLMKDWILYESDTGSIVTK